MLLRRSQLRFSILELLAATTLVAILMAIPTSAAQIIVSVALLVFSLTLTLLFVSLFTWKKWKERNARAERFFILLFQKSIIYSAALIAASAARFTFQ